MRYIDPRKKFDGLLQFFFYSARVFSFFYINLVNLSFSTSDMFFFFLIYLQYIQKLYTNIIKEYIKISCFQVTTMHIQLNKIITTNIIKCKTANKLHKCKKKKLKIEKLNTFFHYNYHHFIGYILHKHNYFIY